MLLVLVSLTRIILVTFICAVITLAAGYVHIGLGVLALVILYPLANELLTK